MPLTARPSYMCVHTAINFTLVEQRLLIAPHFPPLELQANLNPIVFHWCLILQACAPVMSTFWNFSTDDRILHISACFSDLPSNIPM
jgi:hypothetical protein